MCRCGWSCIRPDVVLFDEWLNDEVYDKAHFYSTQCDLMIAVGSSLLVNPAASLLKEIPPTAKLVIINKDATPYDNKASLIIRENCGEVLETLAKEL